MDGAEAVYRVKDNLKQFFVRVKLRRVTATRNIDHILGETGQLLSSTGNVSATLTGENPDSEVLNVGWQQKFFSQHEDELYADERNCCTAVEARYHQNILTLRRDGGRPNKQLFTYVDIDRIPFHVEEAFQPVLAGGTEVATFASQHSSQFIRRRHVSHHHHPVSEKPTTSERVAHRLPFPSSQSMYIMADLRRLDGEDEADEHVLCHIKVNDNGVMSIKPDISRDTLWYRIENQHREIYEYRLEHSSNVMTQEERITEKQLHTELYQRHAATLNSALGTTFTEPPSDGVVRVSVMGNIVSAEGFEYNDLYVTAELDASDDWELESTECTDPDRDGVCVTTQLCRTKSSHKTNIAYFCCPFEFALLCHSGKGGGAMLRCPRVLVEVASLDSWDRHRIEGYGFFDLPDRPGAHDITVHTWRPAGTKVLDKLRRYFIGGSPEIEDIQYITFPADFKDVHLSKHGFRTVSSGSVRFQLNVLHQSSRILSEQRAAELAQSKRLKGFLSSTLGILDAYHRARIRAMEVAGPLLSQQDKS